MNEYKSLLVAQALLSLTGSRLKLKEFHSAGEGYYRFRVQGRRGLSPKLVMPVVSQTSGLAILALLNETSGKRHSWFINGQAGTGCTQIAHYGHSGRVVCLRSKDELRALFGAGAGTDEGLSNSAIQLVHNAPEIETLVVFTENDVELRFELPTDVEVDAITRALKGETVSLGADCERFKQLAKSFGLGLVFVDEMTHPVMVSREYVAVKAA